MNMLLAQLLWLRLACFMDRRFEIASFFDRKIFIAKIVCLNSLFFIHTLLTGWFASPLMMKICKQSNILTIVISFLPTQLCLEKFVIPCDE